MVYEDEYMLALTELLAFNSQILLGHVTLATPHFTPSWHSGTGGP